MPKNSVVMEMIEQICISLLLKQSKSDPSNRLALIILDNVVEVALKSYANIHGLLKKREVTSDEVFSSILDKVKEQNKIVNSEKNDIRKYHKIRNELYRGTNLTMIKDSIIDEYVVLAKILLGRLYDFRASKLEWKKMVTCTKKNLI
jgi:hypothetical protein